MRYHFKCPACGSERQREWEKRDKKLKCPSCDQMSAAPKPDQQPEAWVDQHDPPEEMRDAAMKINGFPDGRCTVPGCTEKADCLDHRVAYRDGEGGRTCVDNLFPMCTSHNSSKGDQDYENWLLKLLYESELEAARRTY